ncbi:MAG: biotin transporter BioY [Pseudomonadota bacterium]
MGKTWNNKVLIEALGGGSGGALLARQAIFFVIGVALLAIAAKIRVPMWPVPITMSTFAVLMIGAAYGPRLGLVTMMGYLLVGALGFDVFAGTTAEKNGLTYMLGGTGGYLVGWLLATLALGAFARRGWDRSFVWIAVAMLVGNALIYVPGLLWLNTMSYAQGWDWTLSNGLTPFLVGDAIKLALAAVLLPLAWKAVGDARR